MGGNVLEFEYEKRDRLSEARGEAKTLFSLVGKNLLSINDAAQELGVSIEEFKKLLDDYKAGKTA